MKKISVYKVFWSINLVLLTFIIFPNQSLAQNPLSKIFGWGNSKTKINAVQLERQSKYMTIACDGEFAGKTDIIRLRPELSGRLEKLFVKEGQWVKAGAVLGTIDEQIQRHNCQAALAELDRAKANHQKLLAGARPEAREEALAQVRAQLARYNNSKRIFLRHSPLESKKVTSGQTIDDMRGAMNSDQALLEAAIAHAKLVQANPRTEDVDIALANIGIAKANLGIANYDLKQTRLRAPSAGTILDIRAEPGELVGPHFDPCIMMADTSVCNIKAFLEEYYVGSLTKGMRINVTLGRGQGRTYPAIITRVSQIMSPKNFITNRPEERFDADFQEFWINIPKPDDYLRQHGIIGLPIRMKFDVPRRNLPSF